MTCTVDRRKGGYLLYLLLIYKRFKWALYLGKCYHTIIHLLHIHIGAGDLAENIADAAAAVADCLVFSLSRACASVFLHPVAVAVAEASSASAIGGGGVGNGVGNEMALVFGRQRRIQSVF